MTGVVDVRVNFSDKEAEVDYLKSKTTPETLAAELRQKTDGQYQATVKK
jgi:hypothetical protein